jgi:murein DD-endopeptidase MepM/ murein hydrolase activator NlpD
VPSPSPKPRDHARRALLEDVRDNRRGWLQHGAAALAVSVLGLGVAGSIALTGNAQSTAGPLPQTSASADPVLGSTAPAPASSVAGARDAEAVSRSLSRAPLDPAKVKSLADQRAEELAKTDDQITAAAAGKKVDLREKKLAETTDKTQDQAKRLAAGEKPSTTTTDDPGDAAGAKGKSCLPAAHYRVAATFGQVGSWARYHTGFDFSAPIGTQLRAPASGVVTNAGRGPASGWAGNYVAIKYPDGSQSLMAHMSTVSVQVGQNVTGCQTVGAVGMTGRTFGPHVHFEIYPAGITPGDVYRAVNPLSWLKAHRLNP